ncbi:MAG: hypothetical protein VXX04_01740, partial [Actinomycetota bacterium]|nr:hypothetical protein [Actinomycetota bacterium]
MGDRHASAAGGLARGGFVEPEKARALLDSLGTLPPFDDDEVLAGVADQLGSAADPDLALRQFLRIVEGCDGRLRAGLGADEAFRGRVIDVVG